MLLAVPKFQQIYIDALPGRPLPSITAFIIAARIVFAFINLGLPILGTYSFTKRARSTVLWINLAILWNFLEFGLTIFALFLPMIGLVSGMSDAKP